MILVLVLVAVEISHLAHGNPAGLQIAQSHSCRATPPLFRPAHGTPGRNNLREAVATTLTTVRQGKALHGGGPSPPFMASLHGHLAHLTLPLWGMEGSLPCLPLATH